MYGKCYSCGTNGQSRSVIHSHLEIDTLHKPQSASSSLGGGCVTLVFLISIFSALIYFYVGSLNKQNQNGGSIVAKRVCD